LCESVRSGLFFGVKLLESLLQLGRQFVETALAARLQVDVVKLALLLQLLVAKGAGKVLHTPSLVEGTERVTGNDQIAHETQIAEQLMIVRFTVRLTFLLVMSMT
jgi:hypothetical protein